MIPQVDDSLRFMSLKAQQQNFAEINWCNLDEKCAVY